MSILGKLAEKDVVIFELIENKTKMRLTEGCDLWFSVDLSKTEVKELIYELNVLYKKMPKK